jgi:hypothetical protein
MSQDFFRFGDANGRALAPLVQEYKTKASAEEERVIKDR